MAKKMTAHEEEDIDALIDRAVDTFFVEAPSVEEMMAEAPPKPVAPEPATQPSSTPGGTPSFDEALDTLFMTSFTETRTLVTSGDDDTDREIDLAVDTLFVEAPDDTPPPETAQLEVRVAEAPARELDFDEAFEPEPAPPKIAPRKPEKQSQLPDSLDLFSSETQSHTTESPRSPVASGSDARSGQRHAPAAPKPKQPPPSGAAVRKPPAAMPPDSDLHSDDTEPETKYDDVMAKEIERHLHSLYEDPAAQARAVQSTPSPPHDPRQPDRRPNPEPPAAPPTVSAREPRTRVSEPSPTATPLRKLREAILTLEWEISRRSINSLALELQNVRKLHQDNVTVDFAALAMRVVLDYVAKRMSRAHPESIRFLMEVADYLDRHVAVSEQDPLKAFHQILTRYEAYKTSVRKAEGLPDSNPALNGQLEIRDPELFALTVERHAKALIRAGRSLAKRLPLTQDPENLIRSFRFLVNRSLNRVLELTNKSKTGKPVKGKPTRKSN